MTALPFARKLPATLFASFLAIFAMTALASATQAADDIAPASQTSALSPAAETAPAIEPRTDFEGIAITFSAMRTKCEILAPNLSGSSHDPAFLAQEAMKAVLKAENLLSI